MNHYASDTEDVDKKDLFIEAERQPRMPALIDWGQTDDALMGFENRRRADSWSFLIAMKSNLRHIQFSVRACI